MDISNDYKIKKNEKGPLQRFKNQNLILKKFGDLGLSVYKAITGKRSLSELKNDVSVDPKLFDQMIEFMEKNELIILESTSPKEEVSEPSEQATEDIPPEPEPPKKKSSSKKKVVEDLPPEPEIPKEETTPEPNYIESTSSFDDEIKPIDLDLPSDSKKKKSSDEPEPLDFVETPKEPESLEPSSPEPTPEPDISPIENVSSSQNSSLGTLEQIIFDKYGDLGLKVYSLIDGQRTAEEIMRQTGLTESKLVEILDFLDEQGIIKLDYPKNNSSSNNFSSSSNQNAFSGGSSYSGQPNYSNTQPSYPSYNTQQTQQPSSGGGFTPMIEGETKNDENSPVPFPVEIYSKAPVDIVRAVQIKTKILLKYGDKGNKIMDMVDGKNDVLDISLKLSIPLYTVYELINFMMENGLLIRRAASRVEVKSKYGDEGYTIYKRYGREGLLFYELVGKEMGIKAMADMVSKDKNKILEMFIFIYQVLGVELPVDKNLLAKELN